MRTTTALRDGSETFTDINGNGTYDANLPEAWAKVDEVSARGRHHQPVWPRVAFQLPQHSLDRHRHDQGAPVGGFLGRNMTRQLRRRTRHGTGAHGEHRRRPTCRMFVGLSAAGRADRRGGLRDESPLQPPASRDGTTEQQLRDRFIVKIASSDSGSLAGAVVQTPQNSADPLQLRRRASTTSSSRCRISTTRSPTSCTPSR